MDKSDLYSVVSDAPTPNPTGLRITIAGRYRADAAYRCRPRALPHEYVFIYTEDGEGSIRVGGQRADATTGDAFLLAPGIEHEYRTRRDRWSLLWFHCEGKLPEQIWEAHHGSGWVPPTPCGVGSLLPDLLANIIQELEQKRPHFDLVAEALAQAILLKLVSRRPSTMIPKSGGRGEAFEEVSEYIRAHMDRKISVKELADLLHVSPRHLARIFHRYFGQTPKQYILRLKLAEAKQLLLSTDFPITEVASRIGMHDPYHFSRLFQQKIGKPPTAFRNEIPRRHARSSPQ